MFRQTQPALAFARSLAVAAMLLALSPLVPAEDDDWNSEFTEESLKAEGYVEEDPEYTVEPVDSLLAAELYVEAARDEKSGVTYLERHVRLAGIHPAATHYPEGIDVVRLKSPEGKTRTFRRTLQPEEVRRRRMERGMPPEQVEAMMDGMAGALLLLGEGFKREANDAGLGALVGGMDLATLSKTAYKNIEAEDPRRQRDTDHERLLTTCGAYMNTSFLHQDHTLLAGIYEGDGRIHPGLYVMGPACMLMLSAEQMRNFKPEDAQAYAKAQKKAAEEAARYASIGGTEVLDGQETVRIDLKGLGMSEVLEDGRKLDVDSMSIWIDPEYYKRRKFRMEGTMTESGKSQRFFIERENQDYRRVGDSYLYEPYLEIFRVGGVLSDKERKEMEKAVKDLEKAEAQLASLPPSQRAMVEKMMGSQMEQARSMAKGGSVEVRIITTDIVINPDFSAAPATVSFVGGPGTNASLVRLIQANLATLGYEPGPATGELDQLTEIAISQYQAERGLEVTGQPSEPLARMLQEEVDAR